ncbi:hypothetical protein ABL78_5391 [Leptomonas seymouri]|uniref:Uncharacterized protein n=1 Tax=Leptomonas seymouri TaxID=5684 RepID=A0A0N1IJV8_LEPSE|nr:hypothetical protein ABL78_5391 [Leptomonas seymouri]|eukprot:KPI85542.1 hypothetical protein ABL78_5391 [Leptomonas seymouri]
MRTRRALVRAAVDRGVVACVAAAAAPPLRRHFRCTPMAQAPRRRTSAKRVKGESALKKTKPAKLAPRPAEDDEPAAVTQFAEVEPSLDEAPPAEADVKGDVHATQMNVAQGQAMGAEEEKESPATSEPVIHNHHNDDASQGRAAVTAAVPPVPIVAHSLARNTPEASPLAIQQAGRRRLLSLQCRFLVGAHAALEGTADCPDPRALAPRLEEHALLAGTSDTEGAADRKTASLGSLLHVHTHTSARPKCSKKRGLAAGGEAAAGPLPLAEAIDVFANVFAFTLHLVQPQFRALAATTTAPVIVVADSAEGRDGAGRLSVPSSSAPSMPSATPAPSFLASPFSISASKILAGRFFIHRATTMENIAPLHWLETSFEELCRRVAQGLHDELKRLHCIRKGACKGGGEAGVRDKHHQRLAVVCGAVREQAASLLSAVESTSKCVGSRPLFAMRRQWKRGSAVAAATRRRTSHRSTTPGTATAAGAAEDTEVRDTLLNTVERVGLELHLVHVWLSRLCEEVVLFRSAVGDKDASGGGSGGATCVEAVLRQALNWSNCEAEAEFPSVMQIQWMLATAMLERVHVQPYHFHHSRLSTAEQLKGITKAGSAHPAHVVEAKHFHGLAALLDFALAERAASKSTLVPRSGGSGEMASPTTQLEESLFSLLASFHAVLPSYAALLPAWQRALAVPSTEYHNKADTNGKVNRTDMFLREDGAGVDVGSGMRAAKERDTILAASPAAVWDVVAGHWAQQEEVVRQEGGLAAVWWLRLLPLWISTATCTLQLRVVATVLAANTVDAACSKTGASGDGEVSRFVFDDGVHQLTAKDVTESLDALLTKSADLLRDTLRFDGVRYEQSPSAASAAVPHPDHSHDPTSRRGMEAADREEGETGSSARGDTVTEAEGNARRSREDGGGADKDNGEASLSAADSPPPLQRNRGKRSLFYKPPDSEESSILHESVPDRHRSGHRSSDGNRHVRFASRVRRSNNSAGGHFGGLATSSILHHRSSAHLSSTSAEAHEKTSALFDVLVLSAETPILLVHRFGLAQARRRSSAIEESWAAAAQAKSELWRLLYTLPSATAVEAAAARSRDGTWSAAQVLRSVLPAAVLSLLPSIVSSPTSSPPLSSSTTPPEKAMKAGQQGPAAGHDAERTERTLRRVLYVLERAQEQLGLTIFVAIDHLLVCLAAVLLRIQHNARNLSLPARRRVLGDTKLARLTVSHDAVRAQQQLVSVITVGATTMLADNPLSWESMNAVWQLRQLRYGAGASALKASGASVKQLPMQQAAVLPSAATHAFAVQWISALTKEVSALPVRVRQHPSAVLANAREILKVLQTPTAAAALPLYAKQVSAAAVMRSLMSLASHSSIRRGFVGSAAVEEAPKEDPHLSRRSVLDIYQGLLDVLTADADLRLLCCYATFVEGLYEVHLRLNADHAALTAWADSHLLPLVLPVVVAGLRRSQSLHNATTHSDLCETTLVLLSPLSRFASNPQVAMSDVLRTHWNLVLLQVSLYCIRMAGRGGVKRAMEYGIPPVSLPSLTEAAHSTPSLASTATWWSSTFAHGAEPAFLCLLDHSNTVLPGGHRVEPRDVGAADGVCASLAAYVATWDSQVRFGSRNWDAMVAAASDGFDLSLGNDAAVPTTHALLARLQASSAAVQAFSSVTLPARTASAEAAPFLASKPVRARQLGYLVRFMEHYLREQERLSRMSDEEMRALMSASASSRAPRVATSLPSAPSPSASLPAVAASLSGTAPLLLLDFVGYLSSAGDWNMVTWSCNIAETVIKIELKRHRLIPEAARAVAATAILSQFRTVPPAGGSLQLPSSLLKPLFSLSDVVGGTPESLLGFYRRSPLQGLLHHPTRNQYRVLAFGLKQALSYLQMDSRKYRAWQEAVADALVQDEAAGTERTGAVPSLEGETEGETSISGGVDELAMRRVVGKYFADIWSDHVRAQKAGQPEQQQQQGGLKDSNHKFRYHIYCLVCLVDACMESAQLYLIRQQGDGEEDIRLVIEASVIELCRSLAANIRSILSLTREQRRTCFYREEAELLWASLCVVATISTVAPRDQKDRFFTPRCVQAIQQVFGLTRQLIEDVMGDRTPITQEAEDVDDATAGMEVAAVPLLSARPLCTVLVRGAQLMLRDPRSSHRLAIRLAMGQRDRDDMTAVLTAFRVLLASASHYEPGRALFSFVWARLALELTQPLPVAANSAGEKPKGGSTDAPSADSLLLAMTVPSRGEYGAILRDLTATCTEISAAATSVLPKTDIEGKTKGSRKTAAQGTEKANASAVHACNVPMAISCVVEDAAALQKDRQRGLQEAAARVYGSNGDVKCLQHSDAMWGEGSAASLAAFTQPHSSVATALESGTVPLSDILDAAIAHAVATARASGGRSSFDVATDSASIAAAGATEGKSGDMPEDAVGFLRLIHEHCQDMIDLLLHVPLRDILRHPQAEMLFSCLHLLQGSVKPEMEDELWRLFSAKWRGELLEPCESAFLRLQQSQLALVRACRAVTDCGNQSQGATQRDGRPVSPAGPRATKETSSSLSTPPPDLFARAAHPKPAAASSPGKATAEASISAAAQQSMRDLWHPSLHNLPHHDDGRRLVGNRHVSNEKSSKRSAKDTRGITAQLHEAFPGELDREATGVAALAAMPDPAPISVLLTILKSLSRRREDISKASTRTPRGHASSHRNTRTTWLAADGGRGSADATVSRHTSTFTEFVEVVLTYTARSFWLLRPRLDDSAWLVWATVERSMAAYPAENGVRHQEWERMCRQWRLSTNLEHATEAAGQLFSERERRSISSWVTLMGEVCPALASSPLVAEGKEEVAVYCYMRSTALYLQLLAQSMGLLFRHRMFGDLPAASPDLVRRRLQVQLQRRVSNYDEQDESIAHALTRDALRQELRLLMQKRQTQQEGVNSNLLEGAALQYVNVSWCIVRHADSLTHAVSDVILSSMTGPRGGSCSGVAAASHPSLLSLVNYADDVRLMVASVLQDTLDAVLYVNDNFHVPLTEYITQTLLTSGFSCDPLYLRQPHPSGREGTTSSAAPAASVVATLLSASWTASTAASGDGGGGGAAAAAAASSAVSSVANALHPAARAELFVGSPAMLGVLTPHFIRRTVILALQRCFSAAELLPVTSALEFYLSRRNVPLSPLLEATTELLTSCPVRSSAVHTYCERLASELTKRKEFRQALAPPTIASVEQGAAGSISNEVVISFVAAIARQDVHVTKKTLAHLLHAIMTMRPDVFGQPPTANRQGKLTLVQVGTTVEATMDTTNPLYMPKQRAQAVAKAGVAEEGAEREKQGHTLVDAGDAEADDAAAVMDAFNADKWTDFTAMTHRKALAALNITLPTVMEVAMHMDAMRTLDFAERRRATQMLKAADDARRERVAVHRSQAQVAATAAAQGRVDGGDEKSRASAEPTAIKAKAAGSKIAQVGRLDASLHLDDPLDFGVVMLHLRYALRKVVHASLRRLLHQQGPRMLADVASMLEMVDPGMRSQSESARRSDSAKGGSRVASKLPFGTDGDPRPYDGILAGTTRVLLSRAVLCAQAIGYDMNGSPIELPPFSMKKASEDTDEPLEPQPVLKLPVPALQASAVDAAISALGTVKGHHAPVGHSSGKIGLLPKEEKAAVHQRVELEREAAVTVGLSTLGVSWRGQQRIMRALRYTRRHLQKRMQRKEFNRRQHAQRTASILASPLSSSAASSLPRLSRASSRQHR